MSKDDSDVLRDALDKRRILVTSDVPHDEKTYAMYIESLSRIKTVSDSTIQLSSDKLKAVVQFDEDVDVELIQNAARKKLKDTHWQVEHLAVNRKIVIRDLAENCDEQTITLYFEAERCPGGGGDVLSVELCGDKCAVVEFEDATVVNSVVRAKHTIYGSEVSVEPWSPLTVFDNKRGYHKHSRAQQQSVSHWTPTAGHESISKWKDQ
jgi:DNA-dependent RNA polymerase auxiliary subunit epsilon